MTKIDWDKLDDFTYLLFNMGDRSIFRKNQESIFDSMNQKKRDIFDTRRGQNFTFRTNVYEAFLSHSCFLYFCIKNDYYQQLYLHKINELYDGKIVTYISPHKEKKEQNILSFWTNKKSFWLIIDISTECTIITYHNDDLYIYDERSIFIFKTDLLKDIIKNYSIENSSSSYPNIIIDKINEYLLSYIIESIFENIVNIVSQHKDDKYDESLLYYN